MFITCCKKTFLNKLSQGKEEEKKSLQRKQGEICLDKKKPQLGQNRDMIDPRRDVLAPSSCQKLDSV